MTCLDALLSRAKKSTHVRLNKPLFSFFVYYLVVDCFGAVTQAS